MIKILAAFAIAVLSLSTSVAETTSSLASDGTTTKPLIKVDARPFGSGNTLTGLDVLKRDGFEQLKGKRVALLTNMSAIDREGNHILDLLMKFPDVKLVTLFSPEHGLYGDLDTHVADVRDTATGMMVYSLYKKKEPGHKRYHPKPAQLKDVDVVVIDMQDIGARFYTYISYMGKMMESCAKEGIKVMVLDRPNPIGGLYVDGPLPDFDMVANENNITCYFSMPVAHGMTMGEIARMFKGEMNLDLDLEVVPVESWKRSMYLDETGLLWVNPSPNIQDLDAAIVYPGIAIPEAILSMGRGTEQPFHVFGSPIIKEPQKMISKVMESGLQGIKLEPTEFKPTGRLAKGHHGENKLCKGAKMTITDRKAFRPYKLGLAVMDYLYAANLDEQTSQSKFQIMKVRGPATSWVVARIMERKPLKETMELVDQQVAQFMPIREKYLLYKDE